MEKESEESEKWQHARGLLTVGATGDAGVQSAATAVVSAPAEAEEDSTATTYEGTVKEIPLKVCSCGHVGG